MLMNVKFFIHILTLTLLCNPVFGSECGFSISDAKVENMDKGVPLYVDRSAFEEKYLTILKRKADEGKKKLSLTAGKCPRLTKIIQKVTDRLLSNSPLKMIQEGSDKIELIVLCSQTRTPPVARLMAGKYLVVPASLPMKAKSEDAIAAVLAHEIAHFSLAHHARLLSQTKGRAPAIPLHWAGTREKIRKSHEREADLAGLKLMSNAGYDTNAAITHLHAVHKMALKRRPSSSNVRKVSSTHPSAQRRKDLLYSQIESCGYNGANAKTSTKNQGIKVSI